MITRSIFKAYDVRGLYPQEVNDESVRAICEALVEMWPAGDVVVAHDGRHGSQKLAKRAADEIVRVGQAAGKKFNSIFVGLATTPMFYFLVNHFNAVGGAMITASHNPKEYNGVKAVCAAALPVSGTELLSIIDKRHGL